MVTLHVWQSGRKVPPIKYKYSFVDFLSNKSVLDLIKTPLDNSHLGNVWVSQMLSIVTGKGTSLTEMPENFLMDLSQYLTISELLTLSTTCKYFHKFYSGDEIWEPIFEKFLRCLCTFVDYDQGQKMGGFKQICRQVCLKNCAHFQTKNLLKNESFAIGNSTGKVFLNLTAEKFNREVMSDESRFNLLPESEGQEDNKQDALKTNSTSEIRSEVEIASQSYFGAPHNSSLSFFQRGDDILDLKGNQKSSAEVKRMLSNASMQDKNDMVFTKLDLRRRLRNLMLKTKKFECEEDCLPGDKTTKYALKYREN